MISDIFAVGDPHGCLNKLNELLTHWNPDKQQLVILGDLIDRGKDSFGVIKLAMKLQKEYGAVILGGNHEDLFLDWIDNPTEEPLFYFNQGGRETIRSFFDDQNYADLFLPDTLAKMMNDHFSDEILFIRNLPNYFEAGNNVFVHAGVNLYRKDWRTSSRQDFRWIREVFHTANNETGKTFIFGHTITATLNADQSCGIWMSDCQTKIGIDGGAVFGGYLLGLLITDVGYEVYAA
ncbi:metallophosphoesterase (plasmid) [Paenibacillus thiaminolyticus]|uniref:metallophosphoesterase n=1 Tax=Paenibacillus thiaminolyticus TaxID=49283 RepID=UPI00232B2186|nr:metallophosphoesterase [Paenibacillus thiaminolyticus]WCF11636.1 metallophosphoesterase [Paenibacillus thiaminolyticus]